MMNGKKMDRKPLLSNRFAKMYPFKEEEVHLLDKAPLVDCAVIRLARHYTLPMDEAVSFNDASGRKIDMELKKTYTSARSACKPSLALMSVSKKR